MSPNAVEMLGRDQTAKDARSRCVKTVAKENLPHSRNVGKPHNKVPWDRKSDYGGEPEPRSRPNGKH